MAQRGAGFSAAPVQVWFAGVHRKPGFAGASSHGGQRTFITERRGRSSRQAAACAMCKTEPVMRVSQTLGATSLAIPRPNARSSHSFVTPFRERRRTALRAEPAGSSHMCQRTKPVAR